MVGIVIVSHSAKLAAGVQELAQQMVQGAVSLAIAAGIDDPENPLGTDAMQVYQAIASVYSDEGVVILMDLGSAVLSAEMALEFLPEEQRHKVKLCEAPLVEGTVAAVVQAAHGATIEQVMAEARGALAAKAALFGNSLLPVTQQEVETRSHSETPAKEIYLSVDNPMGLHARPAAKFVATASRYDSHIMVRNVTSGGKPVNAKSINQVFTLGVRQGHEIAIAASGTDTDAALESLQQLVTTHFGETDQHLPPPSPRKKQNPGEGQLSGIPASPGIAIGTVVMYEPAVLEVTQQHAENPPDEWQQFQKSCATVRREIQMLRRKASIQAGEEEASIFDAYLLYLEDPDLIEQVRQLIFERNFSAAAAWKAVIEQMVASYDALEDPYLQARAADVVDVEQRVLRLLPGTEVATYPLDKRWCIHDLHEPAILVAPDLTPSQTAQLDPKKVLGICTAKGGTTSHTGILARSLGIPAVMGVNVELSHLENGMLIALDGETGHVWVNPDETQLNQLKLKQNHQHIKEHTLKKAAQQPARTSDGHPVQVMANISGVADISTALEHGAEGVGLLRSEFLYLERDCAPNEEEQLETYQAIASILSPRPLIIRTLDVGADKRLPYLNKTLETNPSLGWRGVRVLLEHPELLKTQLRAILRTSHNYPIKVMFPMITSIREIRAVKQMLRAAQAELYAAGIPFNKTIEVGIMVEVPVAVVMAEQLATEVNFFSIGTNDLSQYVMAADRTNPKVATLADAFEPAVLRMIQQSAIAAHKAGIWVGVCGELASSPLATPILVGLGVDELSMNPPAIPAVKSAIARLSMIEAEAIAHDVLQLHSADAVREYVASYLANIL